MFLLKKIVVLSSLVLMLILNINAQDTSIVIKQRESYQTMKKPVGTDYYVCFIKNHRDLVGNMRPNFAVLKLFITAVKDAKVNIKINSLNYKRHINIPADSTVIIQLPKEAQTQTFGKILKDAAVRITSDEPIYVYGLNSRHQTTDSYLAFPSHTLGKEHRVMCYRVTGVKISNSSRPEFAVIATEDSTNIRIIPTEDLENGLAKGDTLELLLNQGDLYQTTAQMKKGGRKVSSIDLTGSYVTSDKPIAVFSGHECSFVPLAMRDNTCNHLVEQVPPIQSWGKHFYIGKLAKRTEYVYRVLANYDSTIVFINNKTKKLLNAGDVFEAKTKEDAVVSANKPVLVAQYSEGYRNGDQIGDPMMLFISPTNQFLRDYKFSTPKDGPWAHYINIIVQTKAISTIRIDGKSIEEGTINNSPSVTFKSKIEAKKYIEANKKAFIGKFRKLGISRYSIGTFQVAYGAHSIKCKKPFGMYSYGWGYGNESFDAYGTMGGQSFVDYVFEEDNDPPYVEIERQKDKPILELFFGEDRDDDSGLDIIKVMETENIYFGKYSVPTGAAQFMLSAYVKDANAKGRALIFAEDMEGNSSYFTICYLYNPAADKYVFEFNEENIEFCEERRYFFGAFASPSQLSHSIDFSDIGNISANGGFADVSNSNLSSGLYFAMKYKPKLNIFAKLIYENINTNLMAPYPYLSEYRNPINGKIENIQEVERLNINANYFNIETGAEWYFDRRLYLTSGLIFSLNISEDATLLHSVISPGFDYLNSTIYEGNVDGLTPFRFGFFAGIGMTSTLPIWNNYLSLFTEITYSTYLNHVITNDIWNYSQIKINIGLKYNFKSIIN